MDDEEYRALTATLDLFYLFQKWQHTQVVQPKRIKYASLTPEEQQMVDFYPRVISHFDQCVSLNSDFTSEMALVAAQDWGVAQPVEQWSRAGHSDFDRVRLTLLQLAREWSDDGKAERNKTFGPILEALEAEFPENRNDINVLVPGCGLGRMVFELVKRGFATQGNEVSYHMLLMLGFMLNRVKMPHSHLFFPYIFKLSHTQKRLFQQRPVSVPDELPMLIFTDDDEHNARVGDLMLMAAGSFVELYGPTGLSEEAEEAAFRAENQGKFHAVATCFFLDTAHNVLDYLKAIHHCLRPGGVWVNLGPLLWHYEGDSLSHMVAHGDTHVPSIMEGLELSRDELIQVIEKAGFAIERRSAVSTTYSSDARALGNFVYDAEFWVARRI